MVDRVVSRHLASVGNSPPSTEGEYMAKVMAMIEADHADAPWGADATTHSAGGLLRLFVELESTGSDQTTKE